MWSLLPNLNVNQNNNCNFLSKGNQILGYNHDLHRGVVVIMNAQLDFVESEFNSCVTI